MSNYLLVLAVGAALATPAMAEVKPIDETRAIAADGQISVENVQGLIRVTGSDRSDVRITGHVGEGAKGLIVEGDAKALRIRIDYPESHGWGGWWGRGDVEDSVLEVAVPKGVSVEAEGVSANVEVKGMAGKRVEVESVSGDIEVDVTAEEFSADAVSGDINAKVQGARELDLETVSGDVDLIGSGSERLSAESVSGRLRLNLEGSFRKVSTSVVSGDIDLSLALADGGRISAESLSGDVNLSVPSSTSAELEIESFSGSIRSNVGTVKKEEMGPGSSLKAKLAAGAGQIHVESFSGDVTFSQQ